MTAIAGAVGDGFVVMGGDSAGVAGLDLVVMAEPKVFLNGQFLIGFTSSFRMGDLLRYGKLPQLRPSEDVHVHRFMVEKFVPHVRTLFKEAGYMRVDNSREESGNFLVGIREHLFQVASDLQVGSSQNGLMAVGCGGQLALGAMLAQLSLGHDVDDEFIRVALKSSERGSAGVRGRFTIIRTEGDPC